MVRKPGSPTVPPMSINIHCTVKEVGSRQVVGHTSCLRRDDSSPFTPFRVLSHVLLTHHSIQVDSIVWGASVGLRKLPDKTGNVPQPHTLPPTPVHPAAVRRPKPSHTYYIGSSNRIYDLSKYVNGVPGPISDRSPEPTLLLRGHEQTQTHPTGSGRCRCRR